MDCPVDLGPDINACEGETIVLDADTGDSSDTYIWFKDAIEISDETMPTLSVTTGGTYTVEVSDGNTTCTDELVLAFSPLPLINIPTPLVACDPDNDGFTSFDLDLKSDEISGGAPGVEVTYHGAILNAENDLFELPSPYLNDNPFMDVVWARVEDSSTGCFEIVELGLQVSLSWPLGEADDLILEDVGNDGIEVFDLTQNDALILAGLDPITHQILYFETLADAENGTNAIATPEAYTNSANPQQIFARVEEIEYGCYSLTSFTIMVEGAEDADNDGVSDVLEDINNNGDLTDDDTDGDGTPNYLDEDDDGDLVPTITEITGIGAGFGPNSYEFIDTDSDAVENYLDEDDDGDGVLTENEDYNNNGDPLDDDTNNNDIPDFLDMGVTLGIDDILSNTITVYPNPTNSKCYIQGVPNAVVTISVFTVEGQNVFHDQRIEGTGNIEVDLSKLPAALYFIMMETKETTDVYRIVKK